MSELSIILGSYFILNCVMNSINKSKIKLNTSSFLDSFSCITLSPQINSTSTFFEGYLLLFFSQYSKEFAKDDIIIFLLKLKTVFSSFPLAFLFSKAKSKKDENTFILCKILKAFCGRFIILFIEFKNRNK